MRTREIRTCSLPVMVLGSLLVACGCQSSQFEMLDGSSNTFSTNRVPSADDKTPAGSHPVQTLARSPQSNSVIQQTSFTEPASDSAVKSAAVTQNLNRGHRELAMGNVEQAAMYYRRVLQQEPDNPVANHRLAVLADKRQDYRVAERYYLAALRRDRKNPDLLSDLGYSYYLQGRKQECERCLLAATRLNPSHERALHNLSLLYASMGDYDRAYEALRRAVGDRAAQVKIARLFPNGRPALLDDDSVVASFAPGSSTGVDPPVAAAHRQTPHIPSWMTNSTRAPLSTEFQGAPAPDRSATMRQGSPHDSQDVADQDSDNDSRPKSSAADDANNSNASTETANWSANSNSAQSELAELTAPRRGGTGDRSFNANHGLSMAVAPTMTARAPILSIPEDPPSPAVTSGSPQVLAQNSDSEIATAAAAPTAVEALPPSQLAQDQSVAAGQNAPVGYVNDPDYGYTPLPGGAAIPPRVPVSEINAIFAAIDREGSAEPPSTEADLVSTSVPAARATRAPASASSSMPVQNVNPLDSMPLWPPSSASPRGESRGTSPASDRWPAPASSTVSRTSSSVIDSPNIAGQPKSARANTGDAFDETTVPNDFGVISKPQPPRVTADASSDAFSTIENGAPQTAASINGAIHETSSSRPNTGQSAPPRPRAIATGIVPAANSVANGTPSNVRDAFGEVDTEIPRGTTASKPGQSSPGQISTLADLRARMQLRPAPASEGKPKPADDESIPDWPGSNSNPPPVKVDSPVTVDPSGAGWTGPVIRPRSLDQ